MALTLQQFLEACNSAELALAEGRADSDLPLQACADQLEEARFNSEELARAGEALMKLRVTAGANSRFFRARVQMAQTLAKAASGVADKGPKVDRLF